MTTSALRNCLTAVFAAWFSTAAAQSPCTAALPDYPDPLGVSAPFAGFVGDRLVVAGGCNFPDCTAADGGRKVYYRRVMTLPADGNGRWHVGGALPANTAYGAAVETPRGLVCIGGEGRHGAMTDAYILTPSPDGLRCRPLPPLPVAFRLGGAALIGTTVYVTGGAWADGACALYALDLDAPRGWQRLKDYPGRERQQPVVVAEGGRLYLAGGYAFDAKKKRCLPADDVLAYNPEKNKWSVAARLPKGDDGRRRCLIGATGTGLDGRLVFAGGVNADIFTAAVEGRAPADYLSRPAEWYRFSTDVLVYDVARKAWHVQPAGADAARAGGVLVKRGRALYMVCGELKPGIRSPRISPISLPL